MSRFVQVSVKEFSAYAVLGAELRGEVSRRLDVAKSFLGLAHLWAVASPAGWLAYRFAAETPEQLVAARAYFVGAGVGGGFVAMVGDAGDVLGAVAERKRGELYGGVPLTIVADAGNRYAVVEGERRLISGADRAEIETVLAASGFIADPDPTAGRPAWRYRGIEIAGKFFEKARAPGVGPSLPN